MSELGIRLHIKLPVPQISERFDDTTSDTEDDDQMLLPWFGLTLQDCTFRRAESVMIVMKNHECKIAHFLLSLYTVFKNEQIDYKVLSYSFFRPS